MALLGIKDSKGPLLRGAPHTPTRTYLKGTNVFNPIKAFKDPKDALVLSAIVGEVMCLGVVVLQNRAMKKNNQAAQAAIDSANELTGLLSNAIDRVVEISGDYDLSPEERLHLMADWAGFVQMVVADRLGEFGIDVDEMDEESAGD